MDKWTVDLARVKIDGDSFTRFDGEYLRFCLSTWNLLGIGLKENKVRKEVEKKNPSS